MYFSTCRIRYKTRDFKNRVVRFLYANQTFFLTLKSLVHGISDPIAELKKAIPVKHYDFF